MNKETRDNYKFALTLLSAVAIGAGAVVRAEMLAGNAIKEIDTFENRYSNTQKEFRTMQRDVNNISVEMGVLKTQSKNTTTVLKEIKLYLRDIDTRLREQGR